MKNSLAFLLGTAIGSGITYLAVKNHFEKKSREEIEEIRTYYRERKPADICEPKEEDEEDLPSNEMPELDTEKLTELIKRYDPNALDFKFNRPFVISPEEFGEIEEYGQISLTYYEGDGVLADDGDEIVEDVDGTVGIGFVSHFGEYEDDSVFVRNPTRHCDYEILLDTRRYSEILKTKPPTF